jgi:opacity protein-like surface antigen
MRKLFIAAAVSAAALQAAAPSANAAEDCCLRITPYLWAMGIDGELKADGREVEVSYDFSDIVEQMNVGGSVLVDLNKGDWVNYLQVDYVSVSEKKARTDLGVKVDLDATSTLGAAATGWRFALGERHSIDVMAGVRYMNLDTELDAHSAGTNHSNDKVYDGMVALRPRFALSKYWSFTGLASVGTGDSDLSWELSPQFVYDCCGWDFRVGYRTVNYKFEGGKDDKADIDISGPMVGVGFTF